MELTHRPELKQKVTLSPQVYQGLSILAMPIAELEVLIETEMLENPVLDVEDPAEDEDIEREEESSESEEEERAWDEWLDYYDDLDASATTGPRDPNAEGANTEEFVGGIVSFEEYLNDQLGLLDVPDEVEHAGRAVIGSLDTDGFFPSFLRRH